MTSLYIHIPFCRNKCYFCSFVVAVGKENRIDQYLDRLKEEAKFYQGTSIETIYVGGGTPTFINSDQWERLIQMIRDHFIFSDDCEFTVEANPEDMDLKKAKSLKKTRVNRVSLGVQSLNERYLKFLGRSHDRKKALAAFHCLREAGFSNINLDLMFSFPGQTTK